MKARERALAAPLCAALALGACTSAIDRAAWRGDTKAVLAQMSEGVPIDACGPCRPGEHGTRITSPLGCAAAQGNLDLMETLLAKGADPNAPECPSSPLVRAVRAGQIEAMKQLLSAGADVNRGEQGVGGPLCNVWLSEYWNNRTAEVLLHAGIDVNRSCVDPPESPIEQAESRGDQELAALLRGGQSDARSGSR